MRKRQRQSFSDGENGAVTIEFVCTLPLFLVALALAFEFGQFFLAHQSTVHNVRAASRYLSRINFEDCTPGSIPDDIVRTGQIDGGAFEAPDYLAAAQVTCSRENRVGHIDVRVRYQPILFGFLGWRDGESSTPDDEPVAIPFVIREEFRIARY